MGLPGIMHVKAHLLNGIREVRPGEGEVLQSTGQTPKGSGICHRVARIGRQLRLSINRSSAGLAICHPRPLEDIESILSLVQEKA
jgi:hypothetical protein